jgi:hypothetical protein
MRDIRVDIGDGDKLASGRAFMGETVETAVARWLREDGVRHGESKGDVGVLFQLGV